MKRHLIIILLLLITLPLLALWWTGHQRLNDDLEAIQNRFSELLLHQSQYVDAGETEILYNDLQIDLPDLRRTLRFQLFLQLGAMGLILFFLGIYIFDAMYEADKKVSFVNKVSHELKTPLTNIRMYAELLARTLPENDHEASRKLQIIQSESRRLTRLINNVLALSRKDNIKLKPRRHNVDLLIRQVVEGFRPSLEKKDIEIRLDLRAGISTFDRDSIEQVLVNLVSNVEKYAADGKLLSIKTVKDGQRVRIQIMDNGPGILPKMKERIFTPFFRVDDRITEGASGTGIGLSLARDLVRQNDGDLCLLEREQGACFEVVI